MSELTKPDQSEKYVIDLSDNTRSLLLRAFNKAHYDYRDQERHRRMRKIAWQLLGTQGSELSLSPEGFTLTPSSKRDVELVLGTLANYIHERSGIQYDQQYPNYDLGLKVAFYDLSVKSTEAENAFKEIKEKSDPLIARIAAEKPHKPTLVMDFTDATRSTLTKSGNILALRKIEGGVNLPELGCHV